MATRRLAESLGSTLWAIKSPDRRGDRNNVCRYATRSELPPTASVRVSCVTSNPAVGPILTISCSLSAGLHLCRIDPLTRGPLEALVGSMA